MEYIQNGDLGRYVWDGGGALVPESEVKVIAAQLLAGLKVMHDNNFCHRDLKPQVRLPLVAVPILEALGGARG